MRACGEDTLDSLARDHRVEERPDAIVGGGNDLDLRAKVTCGPGFEDFEFGVVRAVQQQAVLHDEVRQEVVRGEAGRASIASRCASVGAYLGPSVPSRMPRRTASRHRLNSTLRRTKTLSRSRSDPSRRARCATAQV